MSACTNGGVDLGRPVHDVLDDWLSIVEHRSKALRMSASRILPRPQAHSIVNTLGLFDHDKVLGGGLEWVC